MKQPVTPAAPRPARSGSKVVLLTGLSGLLIVMTIAAYWPAYSAGYVDFDDREYVQDNEHVATGLSAENIRWAFTHSHAANWHPLTWISHMSDVTLFGLNPRGPHTVNVLLHTANAVLLFLVLRSLTGCIVPSFFVAALFAVHPVNVESVAWIAQRKTVLSTLFGILAIGAYGRYVRHRSRGAYAVSLALFGLSLLAKQTLVTLPFALLLLDYWPLRRSELDSFDQSPPGWRPVLRGLARLLPEKIPYQLLALAVSCVTLLVQQKAMSNTEAVPISLRLGNAAIAYVGYLRLFFWPVDLAAYYPLDNDTITAGRVLASLVLLLAITAVVIWGGRRWRFLPVGWFWFLLTLVPVIGLVQVGGQSMADRYAYSSFWGLMIGVTWILWERLHPADRPALARTLAGAALAGVLTVLCVLTFRQVGYWHDTIALFENAAAHTERNWMAHQTLANAYLQQKQFDKARSHAEQGIPLDRDLGRLLSIYGLALYESGSADEAIEQLKRAQQAAPDESLAFTNLGWVYLQLKHYPEAVAEFSQALKRLNATESLSTRRTLHTNLAYALVLAQRPREAAAAFDAALALDPDSQTLLCDAGEVDLQVGQADQAALRLRRAVALDPQDAKAVYLLARVYLAQGDRAQARVALERAIELNPANWNASAQLANLLAAQGEFASAERLLKRALVELKNPQERPAKIPASTLHAQLGDLALAKKDGGPARAEYEQALELWPDNYQANNNLAWLLATGASSDAQARARSLGLARHAASLLREPSHASLSTLAAAYAASGDTAQALSVVREALQLATKAKDQVAIDGLQTQLRAYERGERYTE